MLGAPRLTIELPSSRTTRRPEIEVDHRRQTLARHILDYVQHAEAPISGELAMDEVKAPALVGQRQHGSRCPRAHGALSSLPTTHRQAFLAV